MQRALLTALTLHLPPLVWQHIPFCTVLAKQAALYGRTPNIRERHCGQVQTADPAVSPTSLAFVLFLHVQVQSLSQQQPRAHWRIVQMDLRSKAVQRSALGWTATL